MKNEALSGSRRDDHTLTKSCRKCNYSCCCNCNCCNSEDYSANKD